MYGRVASRHGFVGAWKAQVDQARLGALCRRHGPQRGPNFTISLPRFLMGLVHHFLSGPGTFAEHLRVQWLRVREVRIRVRRTGRGAEELRLWTSLLGPKPAPAVELAQLYAQRWQHELYYREMKVELRGGELLQSHTPQAAAQEVAALVVATALVAQARAEAAGAAVPVLQVSFVKLLGWCARCG